MGGLYTKKQFEKHSEAIDAASSCLSAAIARSDYGIRLEPFQDDFIEISEMFWAKCPITKKKLELPGPDVKEVATVFLYLVRGTKGLGGFQSQRFEAILERCRRKLKGKLLGTRLILMDNDGKPKCSDKKNHKQPCMCKALTLANMAQAQDEM